MKKLILNNHLNIRLINRMLKWHARYYLSGRGKPVMAGVYITDGCNCRCSMCNIWKNKTPSIYPRKAQERAIDALSKTGCYYYSVSGGETTLVKDLPERLEYAARKIPYVHLVTNGLTMNPELARALGKSGLREISISIDGTEEFHNLMRGLSFAFERAWNALDLILTHAPGVKIVVNSVLTPYNLTSLQELGRKLSAYPDVSQKYLPLSYHELFKTEDCPGLLLPGVPATPEEIGTFLNSAVSNPRLVNSPTFLRKAVLFFNNTEDVIPEQKHCLYPYFGLEFDARGFAYPCITGMAGINGLNPDSDLESFMGSGEYRALQMKLEDCKKCRGSMMLCYYEPRLNFPLHKLLYYSLVRK